MKKDLDLQEIKTKYNLHPIIDKLLSVRGYDTPEKIESFLFSNINNLHDPSLIPGIKQVVGTIKESAIFGDRIFIFGDFDCDGMGASAVMYHGLKKFGNNVNVTMFPSNRFRDGYGLSIAAINKMHKEGADLIITLDCGISDQKEIDIAKSLGMKVVVIDHHEKDEDNTLPDCPFIDLKVRQGDYPFSELCGCAATWKVTQYLLNDLFLDVIDIVTMSTVADVVDLQGENRVIVKEGIKRIKEGKMNPGLKELFNIKEINLKEVKSHHFGFQVCPMMNAVGRLETPDSVLELLTLSEDKMLKIVKLALDLRLKNEERKSLQRTALERALETVDDSENVIIYKDSSISPGVVGLVAGDLKEHFNKPTIVLGGTDGAGGYKGSCRSVNPLDMYGMLKSCEDLLIGFGGHKMAAGLSLDAENYDKFYNKIQEYARGVEYEIVKHDMEVNVSDMSMELVESLSMMEPFGKGNPSPKFISKNLMPSSLFMINGKHLKIKVDGFEAIGWNMENKERECRSADKVDLIFTPGINNYRGKRKLQLKIKDLKKVL